ncbi:epoxide hydrolase family protein [Natrinema ejinorense]|uniref:Epoxide hydrolase n=1 Tax=Natrinema ejinorense TaxID=373386 RepID=A0A2A5QXU5_9EURY|nr:epoxide hydrolase family protein [Natrinema ejinorense]PCR91603.1 epoxide hydrolase [Natrinema ejinorense]
MTTAPDDDSVRPFEVSVDRDEIDDLRRRLERTRWPDQLPDSGWEYGTERESLRELCEYWREEFDWTAFEDRCNEFDQYETTIDGQRLHFYHVRSPEPDATPLVLSHGWPGSVAEFLDVLGPLADPAAHGGNRADAFHVVAPSLPGFGFSGPTSEQGYDVPRVADTVAELMDRLGYDRYVAQGGDWGGLVTALLGANYPDRVEAIHTNMLFLNPSSLEAEDPTELLDEQGWADYEATAEFRDGETAYHEIQATKPQSLAYGLTDSPAGLAGWIVEKFRTWSDCDGDLDAHFDRDRLLDNLSVYWLTETINSSMRIYYETDVGAATPESVDVPTGHARYPAEVYKTPRAWAEAVYDIRHWSEMPEGGHFAAMEVPDLFVDDLRSFLGEFD